MVTNDDIDETTMDNGQWWRQMVTMMDDDDDYDDDCNGPWLRRTTTTMDHNGDNVIERSMFVNFVVMVCRRKRIIFFFYFVFFFKNYLFCFFKRSYSLFLWSFVQRANTDGNRGMIFEKMKKVESLSIWSSFDKFAWGTRAPRKLKHKRRRGGRLIWM